MAAERLYGAPDAAAPGTVTLCLATAHPAKFPEAFAAATGAPPTTPASVRALAGLPTRCTPLATATPAALRVLVATLLAGSAGAECER